MIKSGAPDASVPMMGSPAASAFELHLRQTFEVTREHQNVALAEYVPAVPDAELCRSAVSRGAMGSAAHAAADGTDQP